MPKAKTPLRVETDRKTPRAQVSVPLTPAELRTIDRRAKQCRMARSRFIRLAALATVDCPPDAPPAADAA